MERLTDTELLREFVDDCKVRGLTHHTIRCYRGQIRIFRDFLNEHNRHFYDVDKNILKEFIRYLRNQRKVSQKRIENYFSSLSSFYDFLTYEDIVDKNIVLQVRKRYLRRYKKDNNGGSSRKLISIDEMANFINMISDTRDKAVALLLAKTGIRRGELISIDVDDIDWQDMSIRLKPKAKRSNLTVFFDDETTAILWRWVSKRETVANEDCRALFVSYQYGKRLKRSGVYHPFISWAERAGLHNSESARLEDHFTPHCCRHWFTTHLRRAGMPREYIKELRGDARTEAMDIYHHIDREELKKSYLVHIPQLGVE
ncbi:MAG: tyrosine-type recombinase/integrase [Thermoplasmatota archaeon]